MNFGDMDGWFTLPLPEGPDTLKEFQSQRQDSNRALERVAVRQDSRLAMSSQSPLKKDQAELAHCLLGHRVPPLFSCETKARRGGAVSC